MLGLDNSVNSSNKWQRKARNERVPEERTESEIVDDLLATVCVSAVATTHTKPTRRRGNGRFRKDKDEFRPYELNQRYLMDFPLTKALPTDAQLRERYRGGLAKTKESNGIVVENEESISLPKRNCSLPPSGITKRRNRGMSTSRPRPTMMRRTYSDRVMASDLNFSPFGEIVKPTARPKNEKNVRQGKRERIDIDSILNQTTSVINKGKTHAKEDQHDDEVAGGAGSTRQEEAQRGGLEGVLQTSFSSVKNIATISKTWR